MDAFLKEKSPVESQSVSRIFPTKGGNREGDDKQDQREHGWHLGQGRQWFSIVGLYNINLERDYMKLKAKHRPRYKECRLIL